VPLTPNHHKNTLDAATINVRKSRKKRKKAEKMAEE